MSSRSQLTHRMATLEERHRRRPRPRLDLSVLSDAELDRLEALALRCKESDTGIEALSPDDLSWLKKVGARAEWQSPTIASGLDALRR